MSAPLAIVLGSAQDGGLPHPGCRCPNCLKARGNSKLARRVACLGLVAGDGRRFLVDATPDLPRQLDGLPDLAGLLLTHGHMGHVAGLLWFGREAMATKRVPVWLGERLERHLTANEPWASLFREGHLVARPLREGSPVLLGDHLAVQPILVPHRGEWSETFGLRVVGPKRKLLWLPDIDRLDRETLETLLDGIDIAYLDGTFWSAEDLPGRNLAVIPHPMVRDTAALLAEIRPEAEIAFVHLNHSNPLWDEAGKERRRLEKALRAGGIESPGGSPVAVEDAVHRL